MSDVADSMTGINRETWLKMCKRTALILLDRSGVHDAVTTMMRNLDKHPGTAMSTYDPLRELGIVLAARGNEKLAREYIEGFN